MSSETEKNSKKGKFLNVKQKYSYMQTIMATSFLMSCNFMILTSRKNIPFDDHDDESAQVLKHNMNRNKQNEYIREHLMENVLMRTIRL